MDANVYGLLGAIVVWVGTIVSVWIKTKNNRRNGNHLTKTSAELSIVLGHAMELERAVAELKRQHEGELNRLRNMAESWQLRALQCEERERERQQ